MLVAVLAEMLLVLPKNKRLQQLATDYLQKLSALNFKSLSQECKADYILFKRDVEERLHMLQSEEAAVTKINLWMSFAPKIYAQELQRRRGYQLNGETIAKEWSAIIQEIKTLQTKLNAEKNIDAESVTTARAVIGNIKQTIQSIFEFYNGYDPLFSWWVPATQKSLDESLTAYAAAWKAKTVVVTTTSDKSGIVGIRAGRENLIKQLQQEMISYTPEELIEIANKEFAWCDAEMLKASREMGFGDNWQAALEKVKNTYVPAGKQPEVILKLYNESIDFLKKIA